MLLTKNRFDFGCTSRKMREKPTAKPIQRTIRPTMSLTRADTGVRFPNAFALRNRGYASCSIALKQYSFCEWNMSGICAMRLISVCDFGSCVPLSGKECIRREGGRYISWFSSEPMALPAGERYRR